VERHRVAADGAVLDVVLVRTPGDIHWHDDLFAAGVADIRVASRLAAGLLRRRFVRFLAMSPRSVARCSVPVSGATLISLS
jgi:hypothetical protein